MPQRQDSASDKPPRVPPRWFVTTAWKVHRALYRLTPGTVGLRRASGEQWGMMRVTTTGRRSGQERGVILAYIEDGPDLVTMAMNGRGEGEPPQHTDPAGDPLPAGPRLSGCPHWVT